MTDPTSIRRYSPIFLIDSSAPGTPRTAAPEMGSASPLSTRSSKPTTDRSPLNPPAAERLSGCVCHWFSSPHHSWHSKAKRVGNVQLRVKNHHSPQIESGSRAVKKALATALYASRALNFFPDLIHED